MALKFKSMGREDRLQEAAEMKVNRACSKWS